MAVAQFKINDQPSDELSAVKCLKDEISDLGTRLTRITHARDHLEKQLTKQQSERMQLTLESEEKLHEQSQRYEERLTELHGVIAELSKKLDAQKANVIREEDEYSQESGELFSHFTSNDNHPQDSCPENDGTGNLIHLINKLDTTVNHSSCTTVDKVLPVDSDNIEERAIQVCKDAGDLQYSPAKHSCSGLHLEQLQAEIQSLQRENTVLQEQLSRHESDINKCRSTIGSMRDERDRLRKKIRELQSKLQGVHSQSSQGSQTGSPTHSKSLYINSTTGERTPTSRDEIPIAKIAERVKLKKLESGDRQVLGSQLSSLGVTNTKVAEHLVQPLQDESNAQEIFQVLYSSGSQIPESHIREFEVELERLNARIEHLKCQNDLLTLTLDESKGHCDHLAITIGKYESNNVALQLALNYSDQMTEAWEVLSALLETELDLLIANCKISGFAPVVNHYHSNYDLSSPEIDSDEIMESVLKKALDNRRSAENVARHLLEKLQKNAELTGLLEDQWDESTSMTNSSIITNDEELFSKRDEKRLRDYISCMKSGRSTVTITLAQLETILTDTSLNDQSATSETNKSDLENAVLMQELMAIKEERAELKAHVFLLERERTALELRLSSRDAHEQAYLAQIDHLKSEMKEQQMANEKNKSNGSRNLQQDHLNEFVCIDPAVDVTQELGESIRREKKLKMRLQELVTTLEKVTKNSELRHQQSAEFVNDLKRANSALVAAFEKAKKKYQNKIKKLEQQMAVMIDRHTSQVRMLKQRITAMEDDQDRGASHPTNETPL